MLAFKKSVYGCAALVAALLSTPTVSAATFSCEPRSVAFETAGVRVTCHNAITVTSNQVSSLMISTADPAQVDRFLMLVDVAMAYGLVFLVDVPTIASSISGCAQANCRTPGWFGVQ